MFRNFCVPIKMTQSNIKRKKTSDHFVAFSFWQNQCLVTTSKIPVWLQGRRWLGCVSGVMEVVPKFVQRTSFLRDFLPRPNPLTDPSFLIRIVIMSGWIVSSRHLSKRLITCDPNLGLRKTAKTLSFQHVCAHWDSNQIVKVEKVRVCFLQQWLVAKKSELWLFGEIA